MRDFFSKSAIGRRGEDAACSYLVEQGFAVLERNFRWRGGEIDIIAKKGETLHFIEVKYRSETQEYHPLEVFTQKKIRRMRLAAEIYLSKDLHFQQYFVSFSYLLLLPGNKIDFYSHLF